MISRLVVVIDDNDDNNGNPLMDPGNGDNMDASGKGWDEMGERRGGASGGGCGNGSGIGGIFLLYDVKKFLCGGNWQGHTSSHTLFMLEVSRHTFGWGR